MLIWYLENGINRVTERPARVVAKGLTSWFIMETEGILKAIPECLITARLYEHADDEPPSMIEYIEEHHVAEVDYSLSDLLEALYATVH